MDYNKSDKLQGVLYDIRGPIVDRAAELERDGYDIVSLNIGNPALFGFRVADEIAAAVRDNLHRAEGYVVSKGVAEAREAILQHYRVGGVAIDSIDDIYLGNGVSELITMTLQALLDNGDEVLVPSPDYPLWTASVRLSGGAAVHYRCDESSGWLPDLDDIKSKINHRTKVLVIINPNNPTGALYPRELLQGMLTLAAQHNLIVCADEIYSQMVYDGATFHPVATMTDEVLCISYNGLSKNHLACGFRCGWMTLANNRTHGGDYQEGLDMLSNMRLCSNVPAQYAIAPALELERDGSSLRSSIERLTKQRAVALRAIADIEGLSCAAPQAAFYLFPKVDVAFLRGGNDVAFALDLLNNTHILVIQGSGFNVTDNQHFRMTFLPGVQQLTDSFDKIRSFMSDGGVGGGVGSR